MPEADYFNLGATDNYEESNAHSHRKKSSRLRSSSNVSSKSVSLAKYTSAPLSPGSSHLRSPNSTLNIGMSPLSTFRLPNRVPGNAQHQSQKSTSSSSSAHSSRRASLTGAAITKQTGTQPLSPIKHGKFEGSTIIKRHPSTNSDGTSTTPTLVIPPELASLSTQSTSAVPTPQPVSTMPVQHMVSNSSTTSIPNSNSNAMSNVAQDTISPSSSTKSSMNLGNGSTLSLRSVKKQYVLNEKLYLNKMKNNVPDDYYTRGITPSSKTDENDEFDLEMEELDNNKDLDDFDFGTNFFTASKDNDNLVAMGSKFLLHRLEWLKQADPTNPVVEEVFQELDSKTTLESRFSLTGLANLSLGTQTLLADLSQHPLVLERFEWQTMLSNVLKGDIVKSEKTKIAEQAKSNGLSSQFSEDIWLELKAWMNGRSVERTQKQVAALRDSTDSLFQEILELRLADGCSADEAEDIIRPLLSRFYKVTHYWSNMKEMHRSKPVTNTEEFVSRIEAMNSWLNVKSDFGARIRSLKQWVGDEASDVGEFFDESSKESKEPVDENKEQRRFAEQIMKEKDIETIFQRKIFFPLAPWVLETKLSYFKYRNIMSELNLEYSSKDLELLIMFPMRLVIQIIKIRLAYAQKLQNPTMMMIDQMIDDFSSYIKLSVQLKYTVTVYAKDWPFSVVIDPCFNGTVIEAIRYLFTLLHLKLIDCTKRSFKTFKEADELYKYWENLKNVGHYIDGAGLVIAEEFNKLTLRLLHRLHAYLLQQQNSPPKFTSITDLERWLVQLCENVGSMKRKLNRLTNVLTKAFQNSVCYNIQDHKALLQKLKETGHFLIFTGGDLEQQGIYLIGSAELLGCSDDDILKILYQSEIGCDMIPKLEIKNSLSLYNAVEKGWDPNTMIVQEVDNDGVDYYRIQNEGAGSQQRPTNQFGSKESTDAFLDSYRDSEKEIADLETKLHSLGYILVLCPGQPMLWEGEMFNLTDDTLINKEALNFKVVPNTLLLMIQGSGYALEYQNDRFQQVIGEAVTFIERRSSYEKVENDLQRINKAYFRFTYSVLSNYRKIVNTFQKLGPGNEVLNSVFLFARDFGWNFLRTNITTNEKKSLIILLMIKLSVGWISFLVSDCDPTDQKTFRWCVPAMEFAMQITSGWNVLGLDEVQFQQLKQKISACMSLLISHFDVMGARSGEADKSSQQGRYPLVAIEDEMDDNSLLQINSDLRVQAIRELENNVKRNPHQIGKVLDDKDTGNKYLLSLASSISNVSMRWQKRNFVGGGTFGTVYSAVNLDNGEILAVKEIKIQNANAMKKFFPSIKEEMSVLEMLSHPNVVQYYGVEVHRDKVNIFMEYCEGGSMASLLEHGRIEDEMVTQVYTLELLEGLAYLHQSGVVHRDIKPENILLDFNGIIKYVDFGAAKKIAKNGTDTRGVVRSVSSDSSTGSTDNANEQDGLTLQDMMGTPMYMAPESITGSPNKGRFGADDIWSLGCVILEMITGRRPWAKLDNEWAIMYHVAAGHTPQLPSNDEVSSAGKKFLRRCLQENPSKRASAVELLMDPWIVQIRDLAFGPGDQAQVPDDSSPVIC